MTVEFCPVCDHELDGRTYCQICGLDVQQYEMSGPRGQEILEDGARRDLGLDESAASNDAGDERPCPCDACLDKTFAEDVYCAKCSHHGCGPEPACNNDDDRETVTIDTSQCRESACPSCGADHGLRGRASCRDCGFIPPENRLSEVRA